MKTAGTIALLAGFLALPSAGMANTWTLLCTSKGQTIHLERFPESIPYEAEVRALARNPGATCITLAPQTESQFGDIVAPDAQSLAASAPGEGTVSGLGTALRALRGEPIGTASRREPQAVEPGAQAAPALVIGPGTLKPRSQSWVRLGVYKSQDSMDAIADWQRILLAAPTLAYLVPAVTQTKDGWLMLSAGPVRDPIERNGLCVAVNTLELDCIPGETPDEDPAFEAKQAALAMAESWPGAVMEWDALAQCDHVQGIEIENTTQAEGRRGGLISWKSPFDAPRRHFDLAAIAPETDDAPQGMIATPMPPRRPEALSEVQAVRPPTTRQRQVKPLNIQPQGSSTQPAPASKVVDAAIVRRN